ncbi:hypothetical protein E2C01_081626 [Portunus trituberculatus]|uniref:Uncharacterized protein n=1 Tax=Portunus trituberculatus TaxID=210409 RepID=A0A5B7IX32_PORTR|nr:hypothetical protein [Portunus trituberculatus]
MHPSNEGVKSSKGLPPHHLNVKVQWCIAERYNGAVWRYCRSEVPSARLRESIGEVCSGSSVHSELCPRVSRCAAWLLEASLCLTGWLLGALLATWCLVLLAWCFLGFF